jgi:type I restriction enzyme S subunit
MNKFKLNELGSVNRGKSKHRPRNDPALYGGEYPFIQTGDVKHSPFYLTSHSQTYNERGLEQSKLWPINTLCITIAANIAETAILTYPACFPDSIIGFIPDPKKAELKYIKYCLDTFKLQMQSISQGTTQDNMSVEKLLSIDFPIPELEEQRKIAAILSSYDDLIENNRKRIALLENSAEETYREWFVRFRFPEYKKAEFEKGYPKKWLEKNLDDIAHMLMGQSPKSEFYNDKKEGLPFHQGVGTYGDRHPNSNVYCSVDGRTANEGDILFSVRAPVGRLNIANEKMIIGRGLAALSHRKGCNSYLYYLLKVAFSNEDIIGNGSIFNSVGKDELKNFKLLAPPKVLVEKFENFASEIDAQISNLITTAHNLDQTKNMLLSRLISGTLTVEDLDIQFPQSMLEKNEVN